jgi:ribosomal-protein-alanine N-acetyltransferase
VLIRPAGEADVAALAEIEKEAFSVDPWPKGSFLKYDCWVADLDGQVAGFLVSRETYAGEKETPPEREILNLAVATGFRRQGIATLLLRRELTRKADFFLEVRESNTAARTLYGKLGFAEIARRGGYYHQPNETAIVMKMKWC